MPTLTDRQQLLIDLVGDLDPVTGDLPLVPGDGIVHQRMADLWARYADKALFSPRLRELYVVRDACDLLLSIVTPEVTVSAQGSNVALSDRVRNLAARRKDAQDEIIRIELGPDGGASRAPSIGPLVNVVPIPPPWPGAPDANSQRYSGSPYLRSRPRDRR
jgi:hypothetical protein